MVITDIVPISLTGTSVVSSGVVITETASLYVWSVQNLAAGEGGIITVTGVVSDPIAAGTFTNTALIAFSGVESAPANNESSASVTVWFPDITVAPVALAFDDWGVNAGPSAAQTVVITNDGTAALDVTSVSLVGIYASHFDIESDSGEAVLVPGDTRTVQVAFDPTSVGAKSANLRIQSNDKHESTVNVGLSGTGVLTCELAIIKSVTPSTASPHQIITYTLIFTNSGPEVASGVVITDTIPQNLIDLGVTSSAAITATVTNPGYVWQVADLQPGQAGTISVRGEIVYPLVGGVFTNTASIASANPEGDLGDNTASVGIDVLPGEGTLQGRVFNDINANGALDPGEAGVGGVLVTLYRAGADGVLGTGDDTEVTNATTAASGVYSLTNVLARAYRVVETDQAGYVSVSSNEQIVTVPYSDTVTADFADLALGIVSGVVFGDADGDGNQGVGEGGLSGVDVTLRAPGGDGTFDTGDDTTQATTTAAGGIYSFTSVLPGSYRLEESDPVGYTSVSPNQLNVSVGSGNSAVANFADQALGTVGGLAYLDLNGNGQADRDEMGVEGVTFALKGPGGDGLLGTGDDTTISTTTTISNGQYTFRDVTSGNYLVEETVLPGYVAVTPEKVNVSVPSGGAGSASFALQQVGRVGGVVYHDLNGNGQVDAGEPGLGGVVIRLIDAGSDGVLGNGDDLVIQTTQSLSMGLYSFAGVSPGTYAVQETDPDDYVSSTENEVAVLLVSGGAATANFGDQAVGRIGGVVYNDLNCSGQHEAGEPGLGGGIVISLTGPGPDALPGTGDDVLVMTTTTTIDGNYHFDGITPDRYLVQETDPEGYVSSTRNEVEVLLSSGGAASASFGDQVMGRVGGSVYHDLNGDGQFDYGEPGLGGVLVDLIAPGADEAFGTGDDITVVTTTTTSDGNYGFSSIVSGTYAVQETDPPGYVSTSANEMQVYVPDAAAVGAGFGDMAVGRVGGAVYDDRDGDGRRSDDEFGLGGVLITLTAPGADGIFGTGDDTTAGTTTTSADGSYSFDGVPAESYLVEETDPSGYGSTTDNRASAIVSAGGAAGASFGDQRVGTIAGQVYYDLDRNGVFGQWDSPLGGVQVGLIDPGADEVFGSDDDTTVVTSTTNSRGGYSFTGVGYGTYRVHETDPAGYVSVTPNDVDVTLDASSAVASFADGSSDEVRGLVFLSKAWDVIYRGKVTVRLRGAGADGSFYTADDLVREAGSHAGLYVFRDVEPGVYEISVAAGVPAGYDVYPSAATRIEKVGHSALWHDIELRKPGDRVIVGSIFLDHDGNGRFDGADTLLRNVGTLSLSRGGEALETITPINDFQPP